MKRKIAVKDIPKNVLPNKFADPDFYSNGLKYLEIVAEENDFYIVGGVGWELKGAMVPHDLFIAEQLKKSGHNKFWRISKNVITKNHIIEYDTIMLTKKIASKNIPNENLPKTTDEIPEFFDIIGENQTSYLLGGAGWADTNYFLGDEPVLKAKAEESNHTDFWWVNKSVIKKEDIIDHNLNRSQTELVGQFLTEISGKNWPKNLAAPCETQRYKIAAVYENGNYAIEVPAGYGSYATSTGRAFVKCGNLEDGKYYYTIAKKGIIKTVKENMKPNSIQVGDIITKSASISKEDLPGKVFAIEGETALVKITTTLGGWPLIENYQIVERHPHLKEEIGSRFKWISMSNIESFDKAKDMNESNQTKLQPDDMTDCPVNISVGDEFFHQGEWKKVEFIIKNNTTWYAGFKTELEYSHSEWHLKKLNLPTFPYPVQDFCIGENTRVRSSLTNKEITDKIIQHTLELKNDDKGEIVPYGTYVRQLVSGEDITELSFFMKNTNRGKAIYELEKFIENIPGVITRSNNLDDEEVADELFLRKYVLKTKDGELPLKVYYNNHYLYYSDEDHTPCYIPADVDSLYIDNIDGENHIRTFSDEHSVKEIVDNINNMAYIPINCDGYYLNNQGFERKETEMKLEDTVSNATKAPAQKSMIRRDLENLAYRQGAEKMTMGVRAGFQLLISQLFKLNKEQMRTINYMLEQPAGEAVLALALGYGLHLIPAVSENEIAETLAENFRAQGWHQGTNAGLDKVMKLGNTNVLPFIQKIIESIKYAKDGNMFEAASLLKEIEVPDNLRVHLQDDDISAEEELEAEEAEFNQQLATCI
jgi:hypothetical protein